MRVGSMRLLILASAVFIALSLCLSHYVAPAYAADPTLIEVLNSLGFTNVAETTIETFPQGNYVFTLYAKFATYVTKNELSYYQVGTSDFNVIVAPSEGGFGYVSPPIVKKFFVGYEFGFSLISEWDVRYFTEAFKNPDNQTHVKIYRNLNDPGMLLIGFDEPSVCYGGDNDFNDMIFSLQLQRYLRVTSPYDTPGGEGWYSNGTNAFATLTDGVIDYGNGTRRAFAQWNGDAHGTDYSKSDPILMNQNKTAVATWKTQHYLTVKTEPSGIATVPGQGWYDQGQNVPLTAPPVSGYVFDYWDVDGVSQSSGVNAITVSMNLPHTATAHYTLKYFLTIETTPGGSTTPLPGTYPHNPGTEVQVTAFPSIDYVFDYWLLDGTNTGSTTPTTVLMNANHTLKAVFKYSPPPAPLSVTIAPTSITIQFGSSVNFTSLVTGGVGPYTYQWYLEDAAFPGATSDTWRYKPLATGIYFVKLKVMDSRGYSADSNVARVEVVALPVGGYSIPVRGQGRTMAFALYMALVAASAVVLTSFKRKRSR